METRNVERLDYYEMERLVDNAMYQLALIQSETVRENLSDDLEELNLIMTKLALEIQNEKRKSWELKSLAFELANKF